MRWTEKGAETSNTENIKWILFTKLPQQRRSIQEKKYIFYESGPVVQLVQLLGSWENNFSKEICSWTSLKLL